MRVSSASNFALKHLREDVSGSIHSVFDSSFNISLGDFLLHVGTTDAPLSCLGIQIAPEDMCRVLEIVRVEDKAIYHKQGLVIYSMLGVTSFDLGEATPRSTDVVSYSFVPGVTDTHLFSSIEKLMLPTRIGLPWTPESKRALSSLVRFSVSCLEGGTTWSSEASVRAMRSSIEYLLGRGLGLTPSGDDVLCGFGTGLRYLYGSPELNKEFKAPELSQVFFQELEHSLPNKTTAVSEGYLRAVIEGYANEDYLSLLAALQSGSSKALNHVIAAILRVGHTSGADSLLGFSTAFCYPFA